MERIAQPNAGQWKLALQYYKQQFILKKKLILLIALSVIILLSMIGLCARNSWENATGITKSVMNKIDDICDVSRVETVAGLLSVTFTDGVLNIAGYTVENSGMITAVNDILTGIAFCFAVLTFFASFMSIREQDMTAEQLVLKLGLFAVCIVLIFKAQDICLGIANIGTGLSLKVSELTVSDTEAAAETEALISNVKQMAYEKCQSEDTGLFSGLMEYMAALGVYLELLIPSLAMYAVSIVTNVICWSRALEITIYSTFSPIAFADATGINNFGQGSGSRFIKNILALSISGAIIIFIMAISSGISLSILKNSLTGDFDSFVIGLKNLLVIAFAQVGLVLKAQSMAKTLCGVG